MRAILLDRPAPIESGPLRLAEIETPAPGHSAGVVLVPQHMPVSDAAEWLLLIWATMEADEWVNRISFLPL